MSVKQIATSPIDAVVRFMSGEDVLVPQEMSKEFYRIFSELTGLSPEDLECARERGEVFRMSDGRVYDVHEAARLCEAGEMVGTGDIKLAHLREAASLSEVDVEYASKVTDERLAEPLIATFREISENTLEVTVIDGWHRIHQGLSKGLETLPCHFLQDHQVRIS